MQAVMRLLCMTEQVGQALELLKDFFQMPICVGSVSNIEHRVSQSLEPMHEQIKNKIDESTLPIK